MLSNEMLKGSGSLKKQSTNTFKHSKKTNGATGKTMSAIVAQSQSPQETSKGFHNTGNPTPVLVSSYNMASRSSPVSRPTEARGNAPGDWPEGGCEKEQKQEEKRYF